METELFPNIPGNVQTLRHIWASRVQEQEKQSRTPTAAPPFTSSQPQKLPKTKLPRSPPPPLIVDEPVVQRQSSMIPELENICIVESTDNSPPIEESPPLSSISFQQQARSVAAIQRSLLQISQYNEDRFLEQTKSTGTRKPWHLARHVVRSGLIIHRPRRASDSILPLLKRTQQTRTRNDSLDSNQNSTPFQSLVDYLACKDPGDTNGPDALLVPNRIKRSASDSSSCIPRNQLDDSIVQYERVLRHLKNYEQFMMNYSIPATPVSSSLDRRQSLNRELAPRLSETRELSLGKTSRKSSQTQSLSSRVGRTFTEFVINDLFLSTPPKVSPTEPHEPVPSAPPLPTDVFEPAHEPPEILPADPVMRRDSLVNEEAHMALNELDTILDNASPLTANSPVHVIVVNASESIANEQTPAQNKPLMQRLFEGRKTSFTLENLNMKSIRLPDDMVKLPEIAKKKCLTPSEEALYTTKMIKVSRRRYKQDIRLLCVTNERIYNITRKNPFVKEVLLLADLESITCTPLQDGFVCLHTKEADDDRGDWLIAVDHPCELITQLFIAMKRTHNEDSFFKIETQFHHRRAFSNEPDECSIDVRPADRFSLKAADSKTLVIYTP